MTERTCSCIVAWNIEGVVVFPCSLPRKFLAVGKLLESFLFGWKLSCKHAKTGSKNSILRKFGGRIKILTTHNLLHWKFKTVCQNSVGILQLSFSRTVSLCSCAPEGFSPNISFSIIANAFHQWLLSPQIWNLNRAQLPLSFKLRFPPISDSSFPLHFGLLSPLGRKFC